MAKMVKCKTCGEQIAKTANVCPKCGAKQHQVAKSLCVVIALLTVLVCIGVIARSSGNDEPKSVGTNATVQTKEPEKTVFGLGEEVEFKDVYVTLANVYESNGSNFMTPTNGNVFVICEFEISNQSSADIGVSSLMSFEAYIDDYSTNMSLTATLSADKTQLDGTVAAGKKMNGAIGYEAPEDWQTIEVRFTPNFWSGKDIIFQYSK